MTQVFCAKTRVFFSVSVSVNVKDKPTRNIMASTSKKKMGEPSVPSQENAQEGLLAQSKSKRTTPKEEGLDWGAAWSAFFGAEMDTDDSRAAAESQNALLQKEIEKMQRLANRARKWALIHALWVFSRRHPWVLVVACGLGGGIKSGKECSHLTPDIGHSATLLNKKELRKSANPDGSLTEDELFLAVNRQLNRLQIGLASVDASVLGRGGQFNSDCFVLDFRNLSALARAILNDDEFSAWEAFALQNQLGGEEEQGAVEKKKANASRRI